MTLYDYPDCPFAKKVRIVLAEKELTFDTVPVDLSQGQNRTEDFLRLNPFGKVPVLVDEGCVIYESNIISEYLNDEYPHPPELLPEEDSAERARVRLLADYADRVFTLPFMAIEKHVNGTDTDPARDARARELVSSGLAMLERELKNREYLAGEISLADIAFAPAALGLADLGIEVDSGLSNVKAWIQRLAERPSIGSVIKMVA